MKKKCPVFESVYKTETPKNEKLEKIITQKN